MSAFFNPRYLLPVHFVQLILIHIVIGLSVPRLFMTGQPRTRANTIALGMGAKSIIFIMYQVLTEHVHRFRRWESLKANLILNSLETVFWGAVVFLVIQGNLQICVAVGCILSWIVVGVSIILVIFAAWTAVASYIVFRASRRRIISGDVLEKGPSQLEAAAKVPVARQYPKK